jgi:hypothetical protein
MLVEGVHRVVKATLWPNPPEMLAKGPKPFKDPALRSSDPPYPSCRMPPS